MLMTNLLLLSFASLLCGPLLFYGLKRYAFGPKFLDAFLLFSILGLVLFHVLPESLSEGGFAALVACLLGLFAPLLISKYFHQDHCEIPKSILSLAALGLLAHSVLDGLALSELGIQKSHKVSLALAVIVHRLPEGVGIWRFAHSRYGMRPAIFTLALVSTATLFGYYFGANIVDMASETVLVSFQAFMAGTLLHIIFHGHEIHDLVRHKHKIGSVKPATLYGALLGLLFVLAFSFLPDL